MADRPAWLCTAVKGPRGRKWFRTDSLSTTDRALLTKWTEELAERYPTLQFAVMRTDEVSGFAPREYRPWDNDADEDEESER